MTMIPAEGYMIEGGNKTMFRQIQLGIHSVCIQQGKQRILKQCMCYCDEFWINFSHFYYYVIILILFLQLK